MKRSVRLRREAWALNKVFRIAGSEYTHIPVVHCRLTQGEAAGYGEAAGVDYLGETPQGMCRQIKAITPAISAGMDRQALQEALGPGGARNALDCALWDLEAKQARSSVFELLGIAPRTVTTVYTIGIDTPDRMAVEAAEHAAYPALKVKLGVDDPVGRIEVVHRAAPDAELIVDVNQGWTLDELQVYAPRLEALGVRMIEQPLPVGKDEALAGYDSPVTLCADESCQVAEDVENLVGRYGMVNIKLDKTGGLTAALALVERARSAGMELMVGNMLGTSLAMAPAFVVAQFCRYVDIDGPLLQREDRAHPMSYRQGRVSVPDARLWG